VPPAADEDLIGRVCGRDADPAAARRAFDALYLRHSRPLLSFLNARATRGDVDDLHQDIWKKIWASAPTGFRGGNFRAWLYQIARNAMIDLARKKKMTELGGEDPVDDRIAGAGERLIDEEQRAALAACLEKLDALSAEVVRALLGGNSYGEICTRLEIKPERAHKLAHLAKKSLKSCVERAET
jgi:RNA polymerase sigma-70 factor (ECF subfamily)